MAETKETQDTPGERPVDLSDEDSVIFISPIQSMSGVGAEDETFSEEVHVQRPAIVSIEGITGVGKTEIMELLSQRYQDSPDVVVLREPSSAWEQFSVNGRNLLELAYCEPRRYGFIFQLVYFLAVENQLQEALIQHADKRVIICEKSLLSARVVYTELTPELERIRYEVYQTLFQKEGVGNVYPNHIIFLDTEPRNCVGRTERKNWRGEQIITLEYLQRCRRLHMEMKNRHSGIWSTINEHPDRVEEKLEKILKIIDRIAPLATEAHDPRLTKGTKIMSIEGNIGAGKSTLLNEIEVACKKRGINGIRVLREPVEEWEKVTDGGKTILELFYENPAEYGFPMQVLVGITTLRKMIRELSDYPDTELILSERSTVSSQLVFAKMLYHNGFMDELEEEVYQMIFSNTSTWLVPEVMLYLNTRTNICLERIGHRCRKGESRITMEQLERCETYHKIMFEGTGIQMRTIDGDQEMSGLKDWVSIVINWGRQLIQGDELDHLESFQEEEDSEMLPWVMSLRNGMLEDESELYLIKVKYGELKFRIALMDQQLTTRRITWEIERVWPILKDQDIYLGWNLLERDQEGRCVEEDLNESLDFIETVDKQTVGQMIVMEIYLKNKNEGKQSGSQDETISMTGGSDL